MAYGGNDGGTDSSTYRMERGTPYMRRGQLVQPMPKFKALNIYSPTPGTLQAGVQFTLTAPTKVRFPIPNAPTTKTGP